MDEIWVNIRYIDNLFRSNIRELAIGSKHL